MYDCHLLELISENYILQVFHPFYVFQIGSIILWSVDEYMYYASCIFAISMVSIIVSLIEIRRQNQALHDMVASSNNTKVQIIRAESRNSNTMKKKVALRRKIRRESPKGNLRPN